MPCRIGRSKPAPRATSGSACSGLQVAAQAVDERGLRQGRQVADRVGRALGHRRAARAARRRCRPSPKPPLPRSSDSCVTVASSVPVDGVAHLAPLLHERALACAAVPQRRHPVVADDPAARRQRRVQRDLLLGVDQAPPVDAGVGLARPEARIGEHVGERRQRPQRIAVGALVHVAQLPGVERIGAQADAQRVELRVTKLVDVLDWRERACEQAARIEGVLHLLHDA